MGEGKSLWFDYHNWAQHDHVSISTWQLLSSHKSSSVILCVRKEHWFPHIFYFYLNLLSRSLDLFIPAQLAPRSVIFCRQGHKFHYPVKQSMRNPDCFRKLSTIEFTMSFHLNLDDQRQGLNVLQVHVIQNQKPTLIKWWSHSYSFAESSDQEASQLTKNIWEHH